MFLVPTELRSSPIHGIGVFLLMPVKKGDLLWRFDSRIDRIFTDDEVASFPEALKIFVDANSYWHRKSGTLMMCGDNGRFVNHSDFPTMKALGEPAFGDDVAACDMSPGTELTSDYREICDAALDYYDWLSMPRAAS